MAHGIPKGWQELELRDFLTFTPRPVSKPEKKYLSLGIRSHCKGTFIREVESPDKVMMDTLYEVKRDDLIVNITFAWEGAVALVNKSDEGALVSHRFPTYVFNRNVVVPEYFRYLIPAKRFTYSLGVVSPGGAGRNRVLDREDFLDLRFVFPPLLEQKKIAKVLSVWDFAIETVEKLIKSQSTFKRTLMQQMFGGQARFVEFGAAVRKADKLPRGWEEACLKDVATVIFSNVDKKTYVGQKKVQLCNYTDVYYKRYLKNKMGYMNATASEVEIKKFTLIKGDVVITKDSETPLDIGVPAVVVEELDNVICGYHLAILRPNPESIDSIFLAQQLMAAPVRKQFYRYSNGATRFGLGAKEVKKVSVVIPSLPEQRQVAGLLEKIDAQMEILRAKKIALATQRISLMQKLLTGKVRVKP